MALPLFRTQPLIVPAPPNLPLAPEAYQQQYQDQLNNVLRLYFNQLKNFEQLFTTNTGGGLLQFPHGAFSSDQDQTTTANTATLMTLNTTDFSNGGVTISSSKITVTTPGTYNLQFSVQVQNTSVQLHDMSIWLRQNGVDIPGSTGFISIPNSHGGTDGHGIYGWNYYVQLQANDYIELWWSTDNTAVSIQYYPASTGPVRPSTQSVVATLSFVSALYT
jgi:hypothetical protein